MAFVKGSDALFFTIAPLFVRKVSLFGKTIITYIVRFTSGVSAGFCHMVHKIDAATRLTTGTQAINLF